MKKKIKTKRYIGTAALIGAAFLIPKFIEKGGEFMIGLAFCYATCIVNGTRTIKDVKNPALRAEVKKQLEAMGAGYLAEEDEVVEGN